MPGLLFDTSVYIDALRSGDEAVLRTRAVTEGGPVWLSAVALAELYAGADGRAVRVVQRLEDDFRTVERLLLPDATDWAARLLPICARSLVMRVRAGFGS